MVPQVLLRTWGYIHEETLKPGLLKKWCNFFFTHNMICALLRSHSITFLVVSGFQAFSSLFFSSNSQFISKYSLLTVIFSHLNNKQ